MNYRKVAKFINQSRQGWISSSRFVPKSIAGYWPSRSIYITGVHDHTSEEHVRLWAERYLEFARVHGERRFRLSEKISGINLSREEIEMIRYRSTAGDYLKRYYALSKRDS